MPRLNAATAARYAAAPTRLAVGAGSALGAAIGGLSPGSAVGVGIVTWAATVGIGLARRPRHRRPRIDPFTIGDPWRRPVQRVLQARARFDEVVRSTADGPLREHFRDIGRRLDDGVAETWEVARRGDELSGALSRLDAPGARRQLEAVERDGIEPGSAAEARAEALRGRLAAAERLRTVGDDARDRLAVLEARLEEAVARAVELSVAATPDARSLAGDVDAVVDELEAFRLALEEIGGLGGELGPGPTP